MEVGKSWLSPGSPAPTGGPFFVASNFKNRLGRCHSTVPQFLGDRLGDMRRRHSSGELDSRGETGTNFAIESILQRVVGLGRARFLKRCRRYCPPSIGPRDFFAEAAVGSTFVRIRNLLLAIVDTAVHQLQRALTTPRHLIDSGPSPGETRFAWWPSVPKSVSKNTSEIDGWIPPKANLTDGPILTPVVVLRR